jgi:hypothetical protein
MMTDFRVSREQKLTLHFSVVSASYLSQSTHIYRVPQCMSLRRNWDSPTPSFASECTPSPRNQRGGGSGAHSSAGEGLGESLFQRLKKA